MWCLQKRINKKLTLVSFFVYFLQPSIVLANQTEQTLPYYLGSTAAYEELNLKNTSQQNTLVNQARIYLHSQQLLQLEALISQKQKLPSSQSNLLLLLESDLRFEQGNYQGALSSLCKLSQQLEFQYLQNQSLLKAAIWLRISNNLSEGYRNLNIAIFEEQMDCLIRSLELDRREIVNHLQSDEPLWLFELIEEVLSKVSAMPVVEQHPRLSLELFSSYWFYYNITSQHLKAEKSIRVALAEAENVEQGAFLVDLHYRLSVSLIRQGKLAYARYILMQGIDISKFSGLQKKLSLGYFNLAYLHRMLGERELAQRYYLYARELELANDGTSDELLIIDLNLANLERQQGDAQKAREAHQSLLSQGFDEKYQYFNVLIKLELARDEVALGMHKSALELVADIATDKRTLEPQLIDALLLRYDIAQQTNNQSLAQLTAIKLHDLLFSDESSTLTYPSRKVQFLGAQIEDLSRDAEIQQIHQIAQPAMDIIFEISSVAVQPEAWIDTSREFIDIYIASLLHNKGSKASQNLLLQVFNILEYFNQKVMLSLQKFKVNKDNINAENLKLRQHWLNFINAEKMLILSESNEQRSVLQRQVDQARETWETYLDIAAAPAEQRAIPFRLNAPLPVLMDNETYLRLHSSKIHDFALVLLAGELELRQIPNAVDWFELKTSLRGVDQGKRLRSTFANISLQKLNLSGMVDDGLNRIIWSPDGSYHLLPLAALNTESHSKQYSPLGAKASIVRTNSLTEFLKSTHSISGNKHLDVALFANPSLVLPQSNNKSYQFDSWYDALAQLPNTEKEIARIGELLQTSGGKIKSAVGTQATNRFLLSDFARQASILHVASHGHYNSDYPDQVGIVTAAQNQKRGFLSMTELLSKPFDSQLAFISGCETMMGEHFQGVGLNSLAHSLLSNGANSVIATLWPIPDSASAKFVKGFYLHLLQSKGNPETALAKAKQDFIRNGRYRDPKYWAAFVLTTSNEQKSRLPISGLQQL